MNHSIYSADRTTHLKVVAVALVVGIALAGIGITARVNDLSANTQTAGVVKATNKLVLATSTASAVIR